MRRKLRERHVQVVERVRLEVPDGLGEEAGADEEEEVGHDDHEDRQRCMYTRGEYLKSPKMKKGALTRPAGERIDDVAADEAAHETDDRSNRDRSRRLAERDTADEDDCFHACDVKGRGREGISACALVDDDRLRGGRAYLHGAR